MATKSALAGPPSNPPSVTGEEADPASDCPDHPAWLSYARIAPRAYANLSLCLCLMVLLAGCLGSTPTVAKIALVAPFEGLHRPAGYGALAGVRAAIAECGGGSTTRRPPTAYVPLALDDSYRRDATARSLDKLGLDPATAVILGPLSPTLLSVAAEPGVQPALLPFLIHPDGRFADYTDWPAATAYYIQQIAQQLPLAGPNEGRLLVVGAPDAVAPHLTLSGEYATANAELLDLDPDAPASWVAALQAAYAPGDALLWLGSLTPLLAASQELAGALPELPLILGPDSAALHLTQQNLTAQLHQPAIYWAFWANAAYTTWTQRSTQAAAPAGPTQTPPTASAQMSRDDWMNYDSYLFYVAACAVIQADAPADAPARPAFVGEWSLLLVELTA